MKKHDLFKVIVAFFCSLLFSLQSFSSMSASAVDHFPEITGAAHVYLYNFESDKIIYTKGSGSAKIAPASTVKLMSGLVALEHLSERQDEYITLSKEMLQGVEGYTINLNPGETLTLRALLYCLLLQSANDAAHAIAVYIAGSVPAFAALMNLKAAELGLTNTHFDNPHGLDSQTHYTTALDLARLADYCMQNTDFCEIWSTQTITLDAKEGDYPRTLCNHNRLLRLYAPCIGGKTGYTMRCGRCLVSASSKDGHTLVAVTLNCPSDWADHQRMYQYGFSKLQSEHKE